MCFHGNTSVCIRAVDTKLYSVYKYLILTHHFTYKSRHVINYFIKLYFRINLIFFFYIGLYKSCIHRMVESIKSKLFAKLPYCLFYLHFFAFVATVYTSFKVHKILACVFYDCNTGAIILFLTLQWPTE